jgi:uncharacterized protein YkwD
MAIATRPKPKTYHKKRQAQHHRKGKHYLKSYWPYLPMLLIVLAGFGINNSLASQTVLGAKSDFSVQALLSETNNRRLADGENGLALNPQLNAAAQAKAEDMAVKNYWSHQSPDGRTPWSFITANGYQYQTAGENLAYGFNSAATAITGWFNSPEHRANLLDTSYQNVGFGVAQSANYQGHGPETIVVAEYASPSTGPVTATSVQAAQDTGDVKPVARIQTLTSDQTGWSLLVIVALSSAAFTLLMIREGYRVRRAVNQGELWAVHHPWLDIAIVFVITAGIILTRTAGIIG